MYQTLQWLIILGGKIIILMDIYMDTEGCTAAIMSVLNVKRPKYGQAVGEQINKEHERYRVSKPIPRGPQPGFLST